MAEFVPSVDYTSRDYAAIRADLINNIPYFAPQWLSRDSSDLGIVLLELYAYMGDIMSFYIDRAANEAYLNTATQRESVLSIANMLGYSVGQGSPSGVDLTFTNNHPTKSILVQPGLQVSTGTIMNSAVVPVVFETVNTTDVTIAPSSTAIISALEGTSVSNEVLTAAFNGLPSQSFRLAEANAHVGSIEIYVGSTLYTRVDNLIDYPGTSAVYSTSTDAQGNTYIIFGDNVGGRIPQLNAEITASYRVISGTKGNVLANTINYVLSSYSFSDTTDGSGLSVTNAAAAAGGADPESTYSIRVNAPRSIKSINRAVTLADYSSLAIQVNGAGKTNAAAEVFTNVAVYMGLAGASGLDELGAPTSTWTSVASSIETYLTDKVAPGVTVSVLPPTMVPITIDVTVHVLDMYKQSTVKAAVEAALSSMLDYNYVDFGQRVSQQQVSMSVGLVEGVDYSAINSLFGHDDISGVGDVICAASELPYLASLNVTAIGGIV